MGNCATNTGAIPDDISVEQQSLRTTGRKKALLVGINYRGTGSALNGCINDVVNQKNLLISHFGFQEANILMLSDSEDQPQELWPFKQNIIEGFKWLYEGASAGDLLFFQYSGHGSQYQTRWENCDCLCPLECLSQPWPESVILDTEIHKHFYDPLPARCKAVAVFDCCHSGTIANLSVVRDLLPEHKPKPRWLQPPGEAKLDHPVAPKGLRRAVLSERYADHQLWVFSGCQDDQTSADAYCDGQYQGAFTWALIKTLKSDVYHETYIDLLDQIKNNLRGYTQIPALTTTHGSYLNAWYCGQLPRAMSMEASADEVEAAASKKRALLVGINYRGAAQELRGCINDVNNQKVALMEYFGYQDSDILMLTEDESQQNWPNKKRIMEGFEWLVRGAEKGDQLFFQYSGHGSQMTDRTGKEPSGMSDCICPLDCLNNPWPAYIILDTEIHELIYNKLPNGVKLTALFDCCHSGTIANLNLTRGLRPVTPRVVESPEQYHACRWMDPPEDVATPMERCSPLEAHEAVAATGFRRSVQGNSRYKDHLLWVYSGCQDEQTSADAFVGGQYQGAFSWAFRQALESQGWSMRHGELIVRIRRILRKSYTQIPALSTTKGEYFSRYYMSRRSVVSNSSDTNSSMCG
mmetsp:Transcript_30113/g.76048  ORF Transcript_30113/g.76048 Transcript_30113/m.76048 type:complete len:636 (-) Transcript_30113:139-2046(-)